MLKTKNFGRKSLNEIKEILASLNLSFGMKFDSQGRLIMAAGAPAASGPDDGDEPVDEADTDEELGQVRE
jgi:DNA-directed RNA polymerase subunit alpha